MEDPPGRGRQANGLPSGGALVPLAAKAETVRETTMWLRDTVDGTVAAVERPSGGELREGPTCTPPHCRDGGTLVETK